MNSLFNWVYSLRSFRRAAVPLWHSNMSVFAQWSNLLAYKQNKLPYLNLFNFVYSICLRGFRFISSVAVKSIISCPRQFIIYIPKNTAWWELSALFNETRMTYSFFYWWISANFSNFINILSTESPMFCLSILHIWWNSGENRRNFPRHIFLNLADQIYVWQTVIRPRTFACSGDVLRLSILSTY